MKVYNYTIIENLSTFYKYAKEEFGLKGRLDNKTIEEISETNAGQQMTSAGFPLKFSKPL